MFFRNYNKAGAGISKDAPKKEGAALFFDIFLREFWTIVSLNLLFVLTCIPLFTIGPSICAVNYVCAKMVRDEPIDLISDYKHGFKINFKQGILVGLLVLFFGAGLTFSYFFYAELIGYAAYAILALLIIFIAFNVFIFPLTAIINLPTIAIFKNSAFMTVLCAKSVVFSFILNAILFFVNLYVFPLSIIYYMVFGVAFSIFLNMFFAYPGIIRYALPYEEPEYEDYDEDDDYEDENKDIICSDDVQVLSSEKTDI
ncbi:MAG: YesL family protein [Clostridia bacterium]